MNELDDEQRLLIPKPLNELTLHCVYKGIQLGSTLSLITIFPYELYKSRKTPLLIPIISRVGTSTIYGSLIGVLFSVGLMHMKLYKEQYNQYKIWDRAYRLKYSFYQNRVDQFTLYSSITGGLFAFFIGLPNKFNPISAGKGALLSIPFGLLAHILIKPLQKPEIDNHHQK